MRHINPWLQFPSNLAPPLARSLCTQLILQTLLKGFEEIKKTQEIGFFKIHQVREQIDLFLKNLESQKGGVLDFLFFYLDLLAQSSNFDLQAVFPILKRQEEALHSIQSEMIVWKKKLKPYSLENMQEKTMQLLGDLQKGLCAVFFAFTPFLKEMRSDENVLVYLIEHKTKFNAFLEERSIERLLQSFFPAGHDQLRAVIYEGYTKRGFSSFFSKIEPLIEDVQWENACQSHSSL